MTDLLNLKGQIAQKLHALFSSDQPFYARQQDDGVYHKKYGFLSASLIKKSLNEQGSIAVYQKQQDYTVKWICYDFDILKEHLGSETRKVAEEELLLTVSQFVNYLSLKNIPCLTEYSGNRGYHVWILFSENVYYSTAYEVLEAILDDSNLTYDHSLLGIDTFPKSSKPSSGVGLGVKIPLSHHKKSGAYSYLIRKDCLFESKVINELTDDVLEDNLYILEETNKISIHNLEKILSRFFTKYDTYGSKDIRIKSILVEKKLSLEDILKHWSLTPVLNILSKKIEHRESLNNEERKLLVGLLNSVEHLDTRDILHDIFKRFDNYNFELTEQALEKLKGYYFPSQDLIESTLSCKFDKELSLQELLTLCIPSYLEHKVSYFDFTDVDVEIVRKSENNYLLMNDEVQSKLIIDELINGDVSTYLKFTSELIGKINSINFYEHIRLEEDKNRRLITLDAKSRVATSMILKQVSGFLNVNNGGFSHGYQVNKYFNRLHIFKPWLNQWNSFISNINEAIYEPLFEDCYVIKADISSFYESISHDRLQRIVLGDGNEEISNKLKSLDIDSLNCYKSLIHCLLTVSKSIQGGNSGLPQGPAYARYLAELYLIELDSILKKLYLSGEVYLYQRYVDDMFLVCESEAKAKLILNRIKEVLASLNLKVNESKTTIKKIVNSKSDFENYKSQSKYNVDHIDKRLEIANENQKDLAIEEFLKLVESDSAQHDLSFIFSHLDRIQELDDIKIEMVADALESGSGRGSMYRNMFNFLLQNKDRFDNCLLGKKLNILQSEVITSVLVNLYESDKERWDLLHYYLSSLESNINLSDMVSQNIAYIVLCYGYDTQLSIKNNFYIDVLSKSSNIIANEEIFSSLQFELNEINDLNSFIYTLSNIAFSLGTTKNIVSFAKNLLFSKLAIEDLSDRLDIYDHNNLTLTESSLSKLYKFLCLFSISNLDDIANNEEITNYWKFCIYSVDNIRIENNFDSSEWTKYIDFIDVDYNRLNLLLSYISNGSMVSGTEDKQKLFLDYHSVLLVYFILENSQVDRKLIELRENVEESLVKISEFYRWILREPDTQIFPNNKSWFESNATSNGIIALKKGNEILIRKHSDHFDDSLSLKADKYGYSEIVVPHNASGLVSLRERIRTENLKDRLALVYSFIKDDNEKQNYPSVFTNSRVISIDTNLIFNDEFSYTKRIIAEQDDFNISSQEINIDNYLYCYLTILAQEHEFERNLYDKYYQNLEKWVDKASFYKNLSHLYITDNIINSNVAIDILVTSALYKDLQRFGIYERIEKFVFQYVKFHAVDYISMSAFAVDKNLDISSHNLDTFLSVIINSLKTVRDIQYIGIEYPIVDDLEKLSSNISHLISTTHAGENGFTITDFKVAKNFNANNPERKLTVDGEELSYSDINLIDISKMDITPLSITTRTKITGADRIFILTSVDGNLIVPIPREIMQMWSIVSNRYKLLIEAQGKDFGYEIISNINEIKGLPSFHTACYVIQQHNNISNKQAEDILVKWLIPIAENNRELILKLISAHECMTKKDIEEFISKIRELCESGCTSVMIKNPEDYNGTQRILYDDITFQIGRNIKNFNIAKLCELDEDATEVTFILDNIISGAQFIKSLKYYSGERESFEESENLYNIPSEKLDKLRSFFKRLTKINICTVFYNTKAKVKIEDELKLFLPKLQQVSIIHGKNIGGNAFFGTTEKLTTFDKAQLENFLLDDERRKALHESVGIKFNREVKKFSNLEQLNKMNLVSRYRSMPKNCFMFLIAPSIFDPKIRIMNRYEELNAKNYMKDT
ncbi:RNA-directed DNA polymerase [Vibrio parahaemolyticus]|uniref:TOTE conflict system archaeo-eukaryotic primase domain-containing protein n=1 Tax=Vibrio parahaemolyticus TaxID=670 RepID=UPI00186A7A8C|nr:reverse transcriptase domain-containing protein [Vibrio parahaemolyticus]ELA8383110.1 RNA-directed DNA polymerase [Vibrio parahaemolyticus]MBE4537138.1 RNA-directed DNA polymerase [Vibrio parahaemolyticus]MCI9725579.1 RNA-directed DNA polymerase [Vibrio parahaemolyticus]MCZ6395126.1 reverse transcriptase domain-containing protein [Vibrio parahaemolyticus]MDZ5120893.1 reverse transcriptase domain-containing protein [Vibrio parahaemolyticus]